MLVHPVALFGGETYQANGVRFDGTNDYLTRGGDLTGNADGKLGLVSFWIKPAADGSQMLIYHADSGFIIFQRTTGNNVELNVAAVGGGAGIDIITSGGKFTTANGWRHVMASWDVGNAAAHLYVDGVSDLTTNANNNVTLDYTRPAHAVGANSTSFANKLNACLADFYFALEYLDISVAANRAKFISSGGSPVDLGADGSKPTGNQPIVFLSGVTASWHTNKGSGGGFTENGALADCADDPT